MSHSGKGKNINRINRFCYTDEDMAGIIFIRKTRNKPEQAAEKLTDKDNSNIPDTQKGEHDEQV